MTEAEAKTKWCPHVRIRFDGTDQPACNMEKGKVRPKCIASDCMMWVVQVDANDQEFSWTGRCGLAK